MPVTRKQVAAALLKQMTDGGPFFKYGRRLVAPEAAASPGKPALFLIKPNEHYEHDGAGTPPTRTLKFFAVIYTDVGDEVNAVPADVIDDLVDWIDGALAPSVVDQLSGGGRQTLGGLVHNCRVTGEPDFAPGDVPGKGTTVVPIDVILP